MNSLLLIGIVLLVMGVAARFVRDQGRNVMWLIELGLLMSGFVCAAVSLWRMTG